MTTTLLLGVGNTLRRDDAAGPVVVEGIADRPGCRRFIAHQLLPEHADELAWCDRVVFVDAAVHADHVRIERLMSSVSPPALGHACDPAWLLGLCAALHDRAPPAWLLTVPAFDLGFGEGLSEMSRAGIAVATRMLSDWLDSID